MSRMGTWSPTMILMVLGCMIKDGGAQRGDRSALKHRKKIIILKYEL
jgi:hypothetical protein